MQRQKKQFVMILILLVVCLGAFLGVRYHNQKQEEKEASEREAEKITVTELDTDKITAFSYDLDGVRLSFTKSGDDWLYEGDKEIDIDENTVSAMLTSVASLTASETIAEYDDLSAYGLDHPSNTIELTTEDGTTTLYVGNENPILDQYYLKTGDSDTVYLVDSSLSSQFHKTMEELTAEETETEASH